MTVCIKKKKFRPDFQTALQKNKWNTFIGYKTNIHFFFEIFSYSDHSDYKNVKDFLLKAFFIKGMNKAYPLEMACLAWQGNYRLALNHWNIFHQSIIYSFSWIPALHCLQCITELYMSVSATSVIPVPRDCLSGEFRCQDGLACVPRDYVCDKRPDCNDFSDEMNCGEWDCILICLRN